MAPVPITIVTGFLGSGKTTLLLKLLPQLPEGYRLALLKNEFGDLAVDSQLASSQAIGGVQELLNGCICCNLVGQLSDGLEALRTGALPDVDVIASSEERNDAPNAVDRIVIETSGSAFPATLAMEVNRLSRETGHYTLDGVITVIDVENWKGYDDTSYTAKLQAKYTDLVVFNKWEPVSERRFDECLDRLGDLEIDIAWVKSDRGRVPIDLLLGVDGGLARGIGERDDSLNDHHSHEHGQEHSHDHRTDHQSEVEVLSVTLIGSSGDFVDINKLKKLLTTAPKEEVYRIKAILSTPAAPSSSEEIPSTNDIVHINGDVRRYILNWAFGRWTYTPHVMRSKAILQSQPDSGIGTPSTTVTESEEEILRMTIILARYEGEKWKKKIEAGGLIELQSSSNGSLTIERLL